MLPPSPRAMRSQKKARVEEEDEEEEEQKKQEDEEEEEGGEPRFSEEDIRHAAGEAAREALFETAFAALLPPQEGPLSDRWKQKLEGMEEKKKDIWVEYYKLARCVLLLSFLALITCCISFFLPFSFFKV